jgi:hypothetical protein
MSQTLIRHLPRAQGARAAGVQATGHAHAGRDSRAGDKVAARDGWLH